MRSASPQAARGPSRGSRTVFGAALAIYVGVAGWLVWRTAILQPYSDMFDWLERYFRLRADGDLVGYLWAPHNVHHMVWTFAVLDLDVRVFGAASGLFLAVGVTCLAATAALLAWMAWSAAVPGFRGLAAGGAVVLSAMGCHILDATADINTTYVEALAFAVAAIALAERRPAGWPAAALICAVSAGLGNAAGLAVWPALGVCALRRRDGRWAATVAAAGLAFGALYLVGEPSSLGAAAAAGHWRQAGELFLTFLGLPWSRGLDGFGWAFGAAVLAAALAVIARPGAPQRPWPANAAAGLVVFSLGTAALAAVGRGGLIPPDQPPVRYAVFMLPLQAGLWIAILPSLAPAWASRRRTMEAGLIAASAFILLHQALMADYAIRTSDAVRQALSAFHAGASAPGMLTRVYPNLGKARAISERLRREGLYQRELRPTP